MLSAKAGVEFGVALRGMRAASLVGTTKKERRAGRQNRSGGIVEQAHRRCPRRNVNHVDADYGVRPLDGPGRLRRIERERRLHIVEPEGRDPRRDALAGLRAQVGWRGVRVLAEPRAGRPGLALGCEPPQRKKVACRSCAHREPADDRFRFSRAIAWSRACRKRDRSFGENGGGPPVVSPVERICSMSARCARARPIDSSVKARP